jgi:23S rRNA A2030 N6-methylase RlmJ
MNLAMQAEARVTLRLGPRLRPKLRIERQRHARRMRLQELHARAAVAIHEDQHVDRKARSIDERGNHGQAQAAATCKRRGVIERRAAR